jgi:hypothetical protein
MAFVTRKFAHPGSAGEATGRFLAPMAPGAIDSPQEPGEVPDRSTIPEHGELPVSIPEEGSRRPLSQYGTAEEIMGVFRSEELDPLDPRRFVQAPPSYEEVRKATPIARQLLRPMPGYALHVSGSRLDSKTARLSAQADADQPTDPGE